MLGKTAAAVLAVLAAGGARAEDAAAPQGTSPAFEQACVDLLHGRVPPGGAQAISTLRKACDGLMDARTAERAEAEARAQAQREVAAAQASSGTGGATPDPGSATAAPGQGADVASAFGTATKELTGPGRGQALGLRARGPVSYTLTSNAVGWFNGLGANAELVGSLTPKLSWVGGLRYSSTDATNGTASTFGMEAGADYFLYGKHNEGFRVGPRLELAAGRESFEGSTTFAWMGASGEVGYNFIATNGLTGLLAVGLGGRIAGDERENFSSFTSGGDFGPYLKAGLGYSW
ncbi:MAG: hypothetical protein QM767_27045 [Anaeromyxobacter sp.]